MEIYFLRHGKAEEWRPRLPDAQRRLTPEGIAGVQAEAAGLAALHVRPDVIFSSPYPRALETAKIVAPALGQPETGVVIEPLLASGDFRLEVLQTLVDRSPTPVSVMLVGHEPDLSTVIRELCGAVVEMKKGGLALVEARRLEPGQGVLRWLLTPRHLMRSA